MKEKKEKEKEKSSLSPSSPSSSSSCWAPHRRTCARIVFRWYKRSWARLYAFNVLLSGVLLALFLILRLVLWLGLTLVFVFCVVYVSYRTYLLHNPSASIIDDPWPKIEEVFVTTKRDGVKLRVQKIGSGDKIMLIANGVGGSINFCEAVVKYFIPRGWTIITWDYRGLFGSGSPSTDRRLSVRDHADDAKELMHFFQFNKVDVFFGWSMGVQICLEFASLYPDAVERLILVNGTHGKILKTAFQPLFRIPLVQDLLFFGVETILKHVHLFVRLSKLVWNSIIGKIIRWITEFISIMHVNRNSPAFALQYVESMFMISIPHTHNHFRLLQELDAHSAFHLLADIKQPTLVLSGYLDLMTPAYQSFEMNDRLPLSWHNCYLLGTHLILLEFPDEVIQDMVNFLEFPSFQKAIDQSREKRSKKSE